MSTYRKEWGCCGAVTETDGYEPDRCPFCDTTPSTNAQIAILRELLESGPAYYHVDPRSILADQDKAANFANQEWRDHITAKIKELEGAGE